MECGFILPLFIATGRWVRFTPTCVATAEATSLLSSLDSLPNSTSHGVVRACISFFTYLPAPKLALTEGIRPSTRALITVDEVFHDLEQAYPSRWRTSSSSSSSSVVEPSLLKCDVWHWVSHCDSKSAVSKSAVFRPLHPLPIENRSSDQSVPYLDEELCQLLTSQHRFVTNFGVGVSDVDGSSQQLMDEIKNLHPYPSRAWPPLAVVALPTLCLTTPHFSSPRDFQQHWQSLPVYHRAPWLLGALLCMMKRYLFGNELARHILPVLADVILSYDVEFEQRPEFERWAERFLISPSWSDSIRGRLSQ